MAGLEAALDCLPELRVRRGREAPYAQRALESDRGSGAYRDRNTLSRLGIQRVAKVHEPKPPDGKY
jgi:hypothetical protein